MLYSRDDKTGFEYERIQKSFQEELHCHDRMEIFRVNDRGVRIRNEMGMAVYDAYAGDYAVIKSADIHRIFSVFNADIEIIRFPVSYQDVFDYGYVRESFVIPREAIDENPSIKQTLDAAFAYLSCCEKEDKLIKNFCSLVCSVLLSLQPCRRTVKSVGNDSAEEIPRQSTSVSIETMDKFDELLTYINGNFTHSKISLGSLSRMSGLNKTFISALFPKLTGRNFKDHIHYLRINYAIELMSATDRNISEIASLCGFETIRSFNNVFKKVVGTTPSGFLAGLSGKEKAGIDTLVDGIGEKLLDYNWTCNVDFAKDKKSNKITVTCNDTVLKLWCHLRLRMLFFAGKTYKITFTGRTACNTLGLYENKHLMDCNFYFLDKVTGVEHHGGKRLSAEICADGWVKYEFSYKFPEYYKPSSEDNFSVYSSPVDDKGQSFEVRDIVVKCE